MIQHVALELRREQAEQCAAFYRLLGFADADPPESLRERALWLERKGTQVHLMWVEDPVAPPRGHVAVVVGEEGYEPTLARLREAGHELDPRREHWGSPRCFTRDPAGHRVELMAFPPGRERA